MLAPGAGCWAALCDRPAAAIREGNASESAEKKHAGKSQPDSPAPSPFVRVDFCEKCWTEGKRPDPAAGMTMFSFWKTSVPTPEHKKKLLVDDSVLLDVFGRMEGRTDPREIRFRFVLALILMRKRLLKYEGMEPSPVAPPLAPNSENATPAPEIWRMIPRGSEAPVAVENPHLTDDQIAEVSQQLSAILAEEV
jgi:hypothetical protein